MISQPTTYAEAVDRLYDAMGGPGKIATELGITPQTVNRWRRGVCQPMGLPKRVLDELLTRHDLLPTPVDAPA